MLLQRVGLGEVLGGNYPSQTCYPTTIQREGTGYWQEKQIWIQQN